MTKSSEIPAPSPIASHPASSGLRRRLLETQLEDEQNVPAADQLEFLDLTLSLNTTEASAHEGNDETPVFS